MGRFLNADALVSTGQGLLGNNMFAYCGNDPVCNVDVTGNAYSAFNSQFNYSEFEQSYGGLRNVHPSCILSVRERNGTLAIGITGSATAGVGVTGSAGLTCDFDGNVGMIITGGELISIPALPAYAKGLFVTFSNADDIYKQAGSASVEGGSINLLGADLGIDHAFFADPNTGKIYQSIRIIIAIAPPSAPEIHAGATLSNVQGFNIFDAIAQLFAHCY